MNVIEVSRATAPLAEYVQKASIEPIIIVAHEKPMAVIVPIDNTDVETVSLSTNPQFLAIIERSRTRQQKEGGISSEEMKKRLAAYS